MEARRSGWNNQGQLQGLPLASGQSKVGFLTVDLQVQLGLEGTGVKQPSFELLLVFGFRIRLRLGESVIGRGARGELEHLVLGEGGVARHIKWTESIHYKLSAVALTFVIVGNILLNQPLVTRCWCRYHATKENHLRLAFAVDWQQRSWARLNRQFRNRHIDQRI